MQKNHFTILESKYLAWVFIFHFILAAYLFPAEKNFFSLSMTFAAAAIFGYFFCEVFWHRYFFHRSFSLKPLLAGVVHSLVFLGTVGACGAIKKLHISNSHPNLILIKTTAMSNLSFACFVKFVFYTVIASTGYLCLIFLSLNYLVFFVSLSVILFFIYKIILKFFNIPYSANNHFTYPMSPFVNFNSKGIDLGWQLIRSLQLRQHLPRYYFYKISKLDYLRKHFEEDLLKNNYEWQIYSNENHKDIYLEVAPNFIQNAFRVHFWDDCGYALTFEDRDVPLHEDLGLCKKSGHLDRENGRKCALFFPIKGSFEKVPIRFSDESLLVRQDLYLNVPALVKTGAGSFHSVDNRRNDERLFFCLNFYGDKNFDMVLFWLNQEGYIEF